MVCVGTLNTFECSRREVNNRQSSPAYVNLMQANFNQYTRFHGLNEKGSGLTSNFPSNVGRLWQKTRIKLNKITHTRMFVTKIGTLFSLRYQEW